MTEPITFGRPFVLRRDRDISGVSGTGIILDGILWPDGQAVIHWRGKWALTTPHPSMESILDIHDHGGQGDLHVLWADDVAAARREAAADIIEAFDVPGWVGGSEAERDVLRRQVERAIQAVQDGEAAPVEVGDERIVEAIMPIVDQLLEQRDRWRNAVGRAYRLAYRWEGAHGSSMFLVRAAGAELRDELDGAAECDHRLMPMLSGIVPGGPCVVRGPHTEHKTADGTAFSDIEDVRQHYAGPAAEPCTKHCGRAERQKYGCNGPDPADQEATESGSHAGCADVPGIRGLLEHVGIDTRGRDITVAGRVVDAAEPEPQHGAVEASCSNPDHACGRCGECAYEHPGEGGCPEAAEHALAVDPGELADAVRRVLGIDTTTCPADVAGWLLTACRELEKSEAARQQLRADRQRICLAVQDARSRARTPGAWGVLQALESVPLPDVPADQLPPDQSPLSGVEVRDPCPYCEDRRLIPRRQMVAHIRDQHPGAVCDFPLGWRVAKAHTFDEHDPQCSYAQTRGALLCDCHVLFPGAAPRRPAEGDLTLICRPCRDAADGVPGAQHCDDTGGVSWSCSCGHRPPNRRTHTPKEHRRA